MAIGGLDIGTLSGRIELEDGMSPTLDLASVSVEQFDQLFGRLGHTVTEQATAFFTAEAAIKAVEEAIHLGVDTIKELTTEGSKIADVEQNFEHLNEGAGRLGATLLGVLKSGTRDTISDFDLMKIANRDLAAGLDLTDAQFGVVSKGAFALAKATGTDVKDALDTMNDALLKGQPKALQELTGKIDLVGAEQKFAASLGVTADRLTTAGKLHADQLAILNAVGAATDRLGTQNLSLSDKIAQVQTRWQNWYEELAKTVATSPAVMAAFDSIQKSITDAFGGDSQQMLETVVGWIGYIANAVAQYAPEVVSGFVSISHWIMEVYHNVIDTWNGLPDWMKHVAENSALAVLGIVALDHAASAANSTITDMVSFTSNLTQSLTGIPALAKTVASGFTEVKNVVSVLDFTSFADAGASISLLGGSLAALLGPLGLVTVAVGLVFAAWEIGKLQPVSDFFEKIGVMAQGYSFAEASAAVASRRLNDEISTQAKALYDQEAALRKAAAATVALQAAQAAAAEAARVAAIEARNKSIIDQTALYIQQQTQEELKKMKEALGEVASVGKTWKDTIAGINPLTEKQGELLKGVGVSTQEVNDLMKLNGAELAEQAKAWIAAGASTQAVGIILHLTAAETKALTLEMNEEAKAVVLAAKAAQDSKERWSEYNQLVAEQSGSTTDKINADTARWLAATIKSHVDAKTDTADFYDWAAKMSSALTDKEVHDILVKDTHSKAYFDQVATDAKNAYDFAEQHSDQFTSAYIQGLGQASQAADLAAQNWESTVGDELKNLKKDADDLHDALKAGFSFDVTSENFLATAQGLRLDANMASDLAKKGYSFQEIVDLLSHPSSGPLPPPKGPRIPGFAEGGIGDFGAGTLAMLHGPEAIIPLSQTLIGGGGGGDVNVEAGAFVFNYPLMNDPRSKDEFGRFVGNTLMDRVRGRGVRVS